MVAFFSVTSRLHPTYVHAMNNLGNILKERNELIKAEELLSKAVSIQYVFETKTLLALLQRCYCSISGVNRKCVFSLHVLILGRADFAAAWMNLGIVQNSLRKFEEAEKSYRNAIRFRKKYPDCYYNLGRLVSLYTKKKKNVLMT